MDNTQIMAGLYIHIPFCAKRCLYCDFFSNTEMKYKEPYLAAVVRELELRKEYTDGEPVETIYFGGGTPSQLEAKDFDRIFNAIHRLFDVSHCQEITLEANLDTTIRLDIPHISAYHLIYEEGTALYKLKEAGKISPVEEEISVALFTSLIERLTANGYQQYEISNFARPGMLSRHNSSYWTGRKYLGIGPSAHSYNGISRQWNISSLPAYLRGIDSGSPDIEVEELDLNTRYNDFIITGLRTMWGVSLVEIQRQFGKEKLAYCQKQAAPYLKQGLLIQKGETLLLSREGIFISDGIMSDLLWV